MSKPADLTLLLTFALEGREPLLVDDVRRVLRTLGFDVTDEPVGAWLSRMAREDMACIERRDARFGSEPKYGLTSYGRNLLLNSFGGMVVRAYRPALQLER